MAEKKPVSADKYAPTANDLVMEDGTIIINGNVPKVEKRVKVRIPKYPGQKEQPDVPLTINGKTILIQRGVEVEIPESYYALLVDTEKMQEEADNYSLALAN